MLDPRQAFKAAFINQCIEEGLNTEQMLKKAEEANRAFVEVEKQAISSVLNPTIQAGTEFSKALWGLGAPVALAAPPIAGGVAGYLGAQATDIDDQDVDAVKKRELIDELKRLSAKARRQKAVKEYRHQREQTGYMF